MTQAQDTHLGPLGAGQVVPLRPAHGPEQDGVRGQRLRHHILGDGRADDVDTGTPRQSLAQFNAQPGVPGPVDDAQGLADDFRPYAVAGQD